MGYEHGSVTWTAVRNRQQEAEQQMAGSTGVILTQQASSTQQQQKCSCQQDWVLMQQLG
jgi:hypothetical protein